ncbi:hypothetical protein [Actinokineospora diospyrosa]|uniref:Uncharacterized protein n=1 Tax=Actinokineospora diospyrosa TaxID=103728 RepID=A0ABT1I538_9PSEU|nr:hypothetical protein [Actinokineospora diospyrosa]MCP2267743.1 hypothetical protein [Actinokineospora diospyrosa]
MGMFSYVRLHQIECPKCGVRSDHDVQFYFGGCDLETFEVGDRITWDGHDRGEPGHRLVVTDGWGDACPGCGGPYAPPPICDPALFDVFIEDDVITHVRWSEEEFDLQSGPFRANALFAVLDDYPPSVKAVLNSGNLRDSRS